MNDFEELQETKDSAEGILDPFAALDIDEKEDDEENEKTSNEDADDFGEVESKEDEDVDEIITETFEDVDEF